MIVRFIIFIILFKILKKNHFTVGITIVIDLPKKHILLDIIKSQFEDKNY